MQMVPWVSFILLVMGLLALDLGVFHKDDKSMSVKEALKWTGIWILVSIAFSGVVYYGYEAHWFGLGASSGGADAAMKFLSGYIIEKSLSLDNIFVIAMVFAFFKVENRYQHRVLFWGILGALVLRGIMIFSGTYLIHKFSWMMYVFGGFLIYTGIKMWEDEDGDFDPSDSKLIKVVEKVLPITPGFEGSHFFVTKCGRLFATPLFLVLVIVEMMDVMFAVDSIPAIFAVTTDPFIVFTSNVFAILGLRSLYFALAAVMDMFVYMRQCLVVILVFVGVKMILGHYWVIPTAWSLLLIVTSLAVCVFLSLKYPPAEK